MAPAPHSGSGLGIRLVALGMAVSPGVGAGVGNPLTCCVVARGAGLAGRGSPARWHGLAELGLAQLLHTMREVAAQPGSWIQFLECRWHVLSTVGAGKGPAGKALGRAELLQELVELSAACQRRLMRPRPQEPQMTAGSAKAA